MSITDINILIGLVEKKDKDLFLQEDGVHFPAGTNKDTIMVALGLFKSKSDARNNNFSGKFDLGFSRFIFGKTKRKITVLNLSDESWMI